MTAEANNHECDARGQDVGDDKLSPHHTAWIVPGETKWMGVHNDNQDHDIFPIHDKTRQALIDAWDIASNPDLLEKFKQYRDEEARNASEHKKLYKLIAEWLNPLGGEVICVYVQPKHGGIYVEVVTHGDEYNDRATELCQDLYNLIDTSCPDSGIIIDCIPEDLFEKPTTRPNTEG